jgi:hypothetical protein
MTKMLLTFIALTVIIALGFQVFQSMSLKEKWSVVKTVGYSALCAAIAVVILSVVVILF